MKRMQSAPWKPLFQTHVSKITPPTFTLATLSTTPPTSTTNPGFPSPSSSTDAPPSTPTFTPRCRTMIFRGFLASLPPNPHNPLPAHNPPIYTSDALTFTTDSRMAKTGDLRAPPASSSGGNAAVLSTGGAYVEALFWIAADTATGENIQNQWRVRGRCYLLAEADADEATAVTAVLRQCLVPTTTAGDGEAAAAAAAAWSWRREVQAHFANLAPALRGSFANPPPGSAVGVPLAEWDAGRAGGAAGELVKGGRVPDGCVLDAEGHAARARANMRLGVIVPEVVERLDLAADEGRARRWVYSKVGGEDGGDVVAGWKVEETWP